MKKSILLTIVMMVILATTVLAACEQKQSFKDRLLDTCKSEDGVCNDAEFPNNQDCAVNTDSIQCTGTRCVFKELWLAKIIICTIIILAIKNFNKYKVLILLLTLFIILNFVTNGLDTMVNTKMTNTSTEPIVYANNTLQSAPIVYYGSMLWSSNPVGGFILEIVLILAILYSFVMVDNKLLVQAMRRK